MTFEEFLNSPAQPAKQTGTVFLDLLTAANRHRLNLLLAESDIDPFGKSNVSERVLDFCRQVW